MRIIILLIIIQSSVLALDLDGVNTWDNWKNLQDQPVKIDWLEYEGYPISRAEKIIEKDIDKVAEMIQNIDLYPTILELCSLPARDGLDGQSIVPLLQNPKRKWNRPVLTTFGKGNYAVRTKRWRYIRYNDGGEELYDHETDPKEWTNLAKLPTHAMVIERLRKSIPK